MVSLTPANLEVNFMKEPLNSLTDIYFECLERQLHYDMFDASSDSGICKGCKYCIEEKDHHDIHAQTCIFERAFSGDKPYLWDLDELGISLRRIGF